MRTDDDVAKCVSMLDCMPMKTTSEKKTGERNHNLKLFVRLFAVTAKIMLYVLSAPAPNWSI